MTLSDVEKRILDKLDSMDVKIDDLCDRMTKQEVRYDNHIESQLRATEVKFKVLTIAIAVIGTSFAILNIVRGI